MFSKSRAVFNSTGIVILLVLCFFWISPLVGFVTLDNFLHEAALTKFFGYGFGEIFGASFNESQEEHALRLKIVFSFILLVLGLLLLFIGSFGKLGSQVRLLSSVVGLAVFFTIFFIIFDIIHEDHVMNKSHRLELFIFGTIAVLVGVALFYFFKGEEFINSPNINTLKIEKFDTDSEFKENESEPQFSQEKQSQDIAASEKNINESDAEDKPSIEKPIEEKDLDSDQKTEKNDTEKDVINDESTVDKVVSTLTEDNIVDDLRKKREELDQSDEKLVEDDGEKSASSDPFSEVNMNEEEDPLANDTPSKKILPPPVVDELPDDVLKLREELSADQKESETEGKATKT